MAYPKNSVHPKLVGDRTTAQVLAALLEVYESVWIPFGENQRADLVVEDGDAFIRVQCKTGRLAKGAVIFNTCSTTYHHPNRAPASYAKQNYRGQIDYFGVYCLATDAVYIVPVDEVPLTTGSLRVESTKNRQIKGIRWAKDYELPKHRGDGPPATNARGNAVTLWPV